MNQQIFNNILMKKKSIIEYQDQLAEEVKGLVLKQLACIFNSAFNYFRYYPRLPPQINQLSPDIKLKGGKIIVYFLQLSYFLTNRSIHFDTISEQFQNKKNVNFQSQFGKLDCAKKCPDKISDKIYKCAKELFFSESIAKSIIELNQICEPDCRFIFDRADFQQIRKFQDNNEIIDPIQQQIMLRIKLKIFADCTQILKQELRDEEFLMSEKKIIQKIQIEDNNFPTTYLRFRRCTSDSQHVQSTLRQLFVRGQQMRKFVDRPQILLDFIRLYNQKFIYIQKCVQKIQNCHLKVIVIIMNYFKLVFLCGFTNGLNSYQLKYIKLIVESLDEEYLKMASEYLEKLRMENKSQDMLCALFQYYYQTNYEQKEIENQDECQEKKILQTQINFERELKYILFDIQNCQPKINYSQICNEFNELLECNVVDLNSKYLKIGQYQNFPNNQINFIKTCILKRKQLQQNINWWNKIKNFTEDYFLNQEKSNFNQYSFIQGKNKKTLQLILSILCGIGDEMFSKIKHLICESLQGKQEQQKVIIYQFKLLVFTFDVKISQFIQNQMRKQTIYISSDLKGEKHQIESIYGKCRNSVEQPMMLNQTPKSENKTYIQQQSSKSNLFNLGTVFRSNSSLMFTKKINFTNNYQRKKSTNRKNVESCKNQSPLLKTKRIVKQKNVFKANKPKLRKKSSDRSQKKNKEEYKTLEMYEKVLKKTLIQYKNKISKMRRNKQLYFGQKIDKNLDEIYTKILNKADRIYNNTANFDNLEQRKEDTIIWEKQTVQSLCINVFKVFRQNKNSEWAFEYQNILQNWKGKKGTCKMEWQNDGDYKLLNNPPKSKLDLALNFICIAYQINKNGYEKVNICKQFESVMELIRVCLSSIFECLAENYPKLTDQIKTKISEIQNIVERMKKGGIQIIQNTSIKKGFSVIYGHNNVQVSASINLLCRNLKQNSFAKWKTLKNKISQSRSKKSID